MNKPTSVVVRSLFALCFIAATGPAWGVPLSSRPGGVGPHYFGYFASAMKGVGVPSDGCPAGNYTACVANHANVTFIATNGNLGAIDVNDTLAKLEQTRQLGMGAVVAVSNIFFDANKRPIYSWSAAWTAFANAVRPYQDTIVAFYIIDEPPLDSGELTFIGQVAGQLRTDFPNSHRQITFLATSVDADGWNIPDGVDWVGYDCYTPPPGSFLQCAGAGYQSVPYYVARLKSLVRRSNLAYPVGLVMFPVAFEDGAEDHTVEAQVTLLARAEREISLAEHDADFVMVMPFLWQTDPTQHLLGANEFPMVKDYYTRAGLRFTKGDARMAFPTAISASSSYPTSPPNRAFDRDGGTMWNAGAYAPASITASFIDPIWLHELSTLIAVSPAGQVAQSVYGANENGDEFLLWSSSGFITDNTSSTTLLSQAQKTSEVRILTTSSPSWVAWREITALTYGTARVYAYPTSATGAATRPEFITDANVETAWNAGGYAPQSVDLDIGRRTTLHRIRLTVQQSPSGTTTHVIYGGPNPNPTTMIASTTQYTVDRQVLDFTGSFDVRYLRIATTSSPSWVAWREIDLFE